MGPRGRVRPFERRQLGADVARLLGPHRLLLDRELSYASLYGFNMVQVYLHWIVWDRHKEDYLKRIEDFLDRAGKHGLKVNLILWDDCGHVEPSLTFANPVPGRHNSQMMPNPSHTFFDSEAELTAHKDRFQGYVVGVVGRFKDDKRIAFWQLYNECMGPKEQYRNGNADANLNRLLGWTREWVKGTGAKHPVTATGGGVLRSEVFRLLHLSLVPIGPAAVAERGRRSRASLHRDAQSTRRRPGRLYAGVRREEERVRDMGVDDRAGQLPLSVGKPRWSRRAGHAVPRGRVPRRPSVGDRRGARRCSATLGSRR